MSVTVFDTPLPVIPAALMQRWRKIPVAVAVDLALPHCQIDPQIRPLCPAGQQPALFGQAFPVHCDAPDFGAVLHALAHIQPGQVLVIDAGAHAEHAMIGEVLGGHLQRLGVTGIVCDGAVRDTGHLAQMTGLSVYSRFITPRGPTGAGAGQVNLPVTIGGAKVAPGALIIGDDDGLIALGPDELENLIDAAESKLIIEAEWIFRLEKGDDPRHIFGLL